jgi:hypothetical protein
MNMEQEKIDEEVKKDMKAWKGGQNPKSNKRVS